uniref:G-protein coupled receptors family 2 profile 2 domain-containing protein n=1 Tax=Anopheles merus TaxID=30066 RepID=A0A182UP12_ANOME
MQVTNPRSIPLTALNVEPHIRFPAKLSSSRVKTTSSPQPRNSMALSTTTDASVDEIAQKRLECLETLNETVDTTISGFAHKVCSENGEWFRHPETNRSWSNYTTCINLDDFEWRKQVNLIYETGYAISLIAILLSLAILSYFRSLKCARITLHMNLFVSFACNNSLWLLWYRLVLTDLDLLKESGAGCITLHLVLHYFLLTNYSWMLCEGFYLHTVLVSAFVSEKKLLKWLLALGWGSPAFFIVLYGFLRGYASPPNDTIECWMNDSSFNKVFVGPVCISMLLNLVFLFNIMRVLLLKLKAPAGPQGAGPSRTILQAFRATLLLVPLLGLQYILTPFRPGNGHPYERTYETMLACTSSFQGLFVAVLFCFLNGEVIAQVKRKWRTVFLRTRANSYTATQVSPVTLQFVRCGPPVPVIDPTVTTVTSATTTTAATDTATATAQPAQRVHFRPELVADAGPEGKASLAEPAATTNGHTHRQPVNGFHAAVDDLPDDVEPPADEIL